MEKKKTSKVAWAALVVVLVLSVAWVVGFITSVRGEPGYEWCSANYQTQYLSCSTTHSQCETARTQYPHLLQHPCTRASTQVRHFCIRGNGCYLSTQACRAAARNVEEGDCEYITHSQSLEQATSQTHYVATINVVPANATIEVDGRYTSVGQFSRSFPRNGVARTHDVSIRAPGYGWQRFEFDGPISRQVTLISDNLTPSMIQAVMTPIDRQIETCGRGHQGTAIAFFSVKNDGTVAVENVLSNWGARANSCISRILKTAQFPTTQFGAERMIRVFSAQP